jgi:hypothetical protein
VSTTSGPLPKEIAPVSVLMLLDEGCAPGPELMLFIHTTRPMTSATTTTAATLTQIANQFLLPAAACAITSMPLRCAAVAAVLHCGSRTLMRCP